jgi:hypothetical protein
MRRNLASTVMAMSALAVLLGCGMWLLLAQPWVCNICTAIDINSGDLRRQIYICSFQVKDEIEESSFSREVRRLGIGIPATQVWKSAQSRALLPGIDNWCPYGSVVPMCDYLVELLQQSNLSEQDQRMILERFLATLHTGTPRDLTEFLSRLVGYIKGVQVRDDLRRTRTDANLAEIIGEFREEAGETETN